jgi:hypothetical protein
MLCLQKTHSNLQEYSIEHVIPISEGGNSQDKNLSISHRWCNSIRGSLECRLEWDIRLANYSEFYKGLMRKKSKGARKYLYRTFISH